MNWTGRLDSPSSHLALTLYLACTYKAELATEDSSCDQHHRYRKRLNESNRIRERAVMMH
eukprot:scaffold422984_cov51-Attheya_sp.AAC.2